MTRYATVVEVASDSSDATYQVYVAEDGPIFCSCPGFRLRHGRVEDRKRCKHMVRLGASSALGPAMALAQSASGAGAAAVSLAAGAKEAVRQSTDRRFRFLEVHEETTEGSWVAVADLRRFTNLEA